MCGCTSNISRSGPTTCKKLGNSLNIQYNKLRTLISLLEEGESKEEAKEVLLEASGYRGTGECPTPEFIGQLKTYVNNGYAEYNRGI